MDHNLDDSLNLESAMGVDFEQPEDIVVSEAGMTLDHTPMEESISMEFDHTGEQPMLMDTGSEEIIDFMGDQFTLQEYSVQSDQTTGLTTTVESNQQHLLTTQSDTMIDIQFQPQIVKSVKADVRIPKVITVKAASTRSIAKEGKTLLASAPKEVAIAPKPPKAMMKTYTPPKQLAIAPKPMNMPSNRGQSLVKKVSLANVSTTRGNTLMDQLRRQLIMMPSSSQKIKVVSATGTAPNVQYIKANPDQAQITNKSLSSTQNKRLVTKVFTVPGKKNIEQPTVIAKILPAGSKPQPRFVTVPPKNLPFTLGNKVVMAAPAKQGVVKLTKKQEIITIKSPNAKLLPAPSTMVPVTSGSSKVLISNATKNVILKPAPPITTEVANSSKVVIENQKSQLHQINVPGKGVQYVRIFTNPSTQPSKPAPKPVLLNAKTFVLTDNKGNIIQMTAEKMTPGEPPSLVLTNTNSTATKPKQKLVRIAPVLPKITQTTTLHRSSQSLLAPLSPAQVTTSDSYAALPEIKTLLDQSEEEEEAEAAARAAAEEEAVDSKTALRQLIENVVSDDAHLSMNEVEIEYKQHHSPPQDSSVDDMEQLDSSGQSEDQHPFIVLPTKYEAQQSPVEQGAVEEQERLDDSQQLDNSMLNMDDATMNNTYQTSNVSDTDMVSSDLGLRPRKACNCTKSQCLKLYCDCFANGEFCNRCNCVNCHNNLENEEMRQKAIRGCLDRNPNAFRPKIGKSKTGGPEIIRRHNKGCNCKRSGCLKNYCECYEAKIACTAICKCVGCRNVEETLERRHRNHLPRLLPAPPPVAPLAPKQPCSFMTTEVIEAVCQCLIAAAVETKEEQEQREVDPMRDVIEEFARCLQDIISAAHQSTPAGFMEEEPT